MNRETFEKYFKFDEKKKRLSIISNIVAEEIVDYDVDDYVKSNYNSDMTSLFVDKNVANISNFIMGQHFFLNVDVDRDNCFFQSFNNCLLSKDSSEMYYCELPLKKKDFVIPKGVKRIMPYCFFFEDYYFDYGQVKLKHIVFNDELLEIKENAFRGSYNGQTIFINEKLENIKEDSFNCHGLKFNIGENKNFKNEHGIITFKDIVLSVESSEVLCNLRNLLKKCSSGIYATILDAINRALLDMANGIDSNEAKILKAYLSNYNGFINSKDTLLAYFGESDCLKIPEGIKNVYNGYQGKIVKQLYIPASLQNIDLIKSDYGPATSRLFIGIENIFVDKMNKNYYANKYFLYNIKKNEVIYNMIKDKEVVIDDPVITNINDILRFTPVETIIFNNDFLLTINGQLGRRHSCVRDVVFNSSKIIFSDDIFNGMTTIEHIFVREEDFAKTLFERIPRQYKDKIFCLCEDDVNESIMFYRNNTYRLFKNKTIQKRTVDKRTSLLHYIKETPTFTRYSIAEFLSCTPATALNYLKIMVKDNVLSVSDFEKEKKRTKAQEFIKAEKKVFELLTGKSVNMDELVNMLDPSEKQSHFYSSLI